MASFTSISRISDSCLPREKWPFLSPRGPWGSDPYSFSPEPPTHSPIPAPSSVWPTCGLRIATEAHKAHAGWPFPVGCYFFRHLFALISCETERLEVAHGWTGEHSGASTHHPEFGMMTHQLSGSTFAGGELTPVSWEDE